MPTHSEKTIAFLNKLAADDSTPWYDKGAWGANAPFRQGLTMEGFQGLVKDINSGSLDDKSEPELKAEFESRKPGFLSNYAAALGRGHVGTLAATGGAALLAGVITHNLMKKNKRPTR